MKIKKRTKPLDLHKYETFLRQLRTNFPKLSEESNGRDKGPVPASPQLF
ncbi:hypothetical protein GCM10027286_23540 [Virgibacillus ainsalahensis]